MAVVTLSRALSRRFDRHRAIARWTLPIWLYVSVTGVLVFLFLLLHIVDVSLLRWPETYDQVHRLYGNVLLRLFEVGLLFALLFHTFNGVRIVAVDVFPDAVRNQRRLLQVVVALTVVLGVPGGVVILWPFIDGRIL